MAAITSSDKNWPIEDNLRETYLLVFNYISFFFLFFPSTESSKWPVTNFVLLPLEPFLHSDIFPFQKDGPLLGLAL